MKTITKEKCRRYLHNFLRYFAVYAILPILCGGLLGLLLTINSVGAQELEDFASRCGQKNLFLSAGASVDGDTTGFYFLSAELPVLLRTSSRISYGSAGYFDPVEKTEKREDAVHYDALPANAQPIVKCNLSSPSFFINTTNYTIDIPAARAAAYPSGTTANAGEPLVLVLHTHGTESYFEDHTNLSDFAQGDIESYFLEGEGSFRTSDPARSVVQVGRVFCDTLTSLGIPSIHCEIMHDAEDFNSAYVNAAETIKSYLAQYPSIQYVVDLHRDSIMREESYVKSFTEIEGKPSAQVMLVVGSNQNGRHPNWLSNLVVATAYKDAMDALYPSLSRSLYIRTARFNQEYLPGSMLLEVGSCANTLEEAENAAAFAAQSFAKMLKDHS